MHCFVLATPVIKFPYYERERQIAVLHVFPDRSHEIFINRCLYHFDLFPFQYFSRIFFICVIIGCFLNLLQIQKIHASEDILYIFLT